ncbi:hypothetical protein ACFYWP_01475 [Actinacidiphila glaucinigra]|uniref:hypothetical protein n=1 Tax=Actinacidiphila glaucinigra TaxID=235986 RepID=UPI0036893358
MKYLKVSVSGPYINTERVSYHEVRDDFDADDKDHEEAIAIQEDDVWEYVDSYFEVVDEDDVPEYERP